MHQKRESTRERERKLCPILPHCDGDADEIILPPTASLRMPEVYVSYCLILNTRNSLSQTASQFSIEYQMISNKSYACLRARVFVCHHGGLYLECGVERNHAKGVKSITHLMHPSSFVIVCIVREQGHNTNDWVSHPIQKLFTSPNGIAVNS